MNHHGFGTPFSTTTRTGHLVTTTRMEAWAPALFETRVSLGGKEICLWDCNREAEAAEQHTELVAKHGGPPIEAPEGLTSAEYIKLAVDALAQAGLSRWALLDAVRTVRAALDNDPRTCRLVGDDLDGARLEAEVQCALLLKAD